jgi:hypothetical protein
MILAASLRTHSARVGASRATLVTVLIAALAAGAGAAHAQMPSPCATPSAGTACPATLRFALQRATADNDLGWTGRDHDQPYGGDLTVAVSGCAGSTHPNCGQCTLSGPVVNTSGRPVGNRRCTGDTSVACTSNTDCTGVGTCAFYLGAPLGVSVGGFGLCVVNPIAGGVTGTTNLDDGTTALKLSVTYSIHGALGSPNEPCPQCRGDATPNDGVRSGTCSDGPRSGLTCDAHATSTFSGATSFDCPPPPATLIASLPLALDLATGLQTRTLSAASPNCRAFGFTGLKCFCDTCNNATATPCASNADCVAAGATICGGKRCFGGTNNGKACTNNSECQSGACDVPGQLTAPNQCSNGVCSPNTPPDQDSVNEGTCATGPTTRTCAIDSFRGCVSDAGCPRPGDRCTAVVTHRECFTDNGVIGGSVSVAGAAAVPCADDSSRAGLSALFCMGTAPNDAANTIIGLPGLGRITFAFKTEPTPIRTAVPTPTTTATPNCNDGVKNGNETDVDCGGQCCCPPGTPPQACYFRGEALCLQSACKRCVANQFCICGSDCESGVCAFEWTGDIGRRVFRRCTLGFAIEQPPIHHPTGNPKEAAAVVIGNFFYVPAKLAFAALGSIASGVTYVVTIGNSDAARSVWRTSTGGDYLITRRMVAQGEMPRYLGETKRDGTSE